MSELRWSRRALLARSAMLGIGLAVWRPPLAWAQQGPRRPLLMAHGFGSSVSRWHDPANLVVAQLIDSGYRLDGQSLLPWRYPAAAESSDEDSRGDMPTAGRALAARISEAARQSSDGQVDLLGFSMGGLVARWALNYLRDHAPGRRPVAQRLIMLATPNLGADLLDLLSRLDPRYGGQLYDVARQQGFDLESPAAQQMRPGSEFLGDLNREEAIDDRVRYTLLGGNLQVRVVVSQLLEVSLDVGDGLISLPSALYLPVAARGYVAPEQLDPGTDGTDAALQRSRVLHHALTANSDIATAIVAELLPELSRAERAHQANLAAGSLVQR